MKIKTPHIPRDTDELDNFSAPELRIEDQFLIRDIEDRDRQHRVPVRHQSPVGAVKAPEFLEIAGEGVAYAEIMEITR